MGVVVSLLVMLVLMVVVMVVVSVVAGGFVVVHLNCLPSSASLTVARATWKGEVSGVLTARDGPEKMAARMTFMGVGVVIVAIVMEVAGLVTRVDGMGKIVVVLVVGVTVMLSMLLADVVGEWVVVVGMGVVEMEVVLGVVMHGVGDRVDEKCE